MADSHMARVADVSQHCRYVSLLAGALSGQPGSAGSDSTTVLPAGPRCLPLFSGIASLDPAQHTLSFKSASSR
jgi:hypothetical protein